MPQENVDRSSPLEIFRTAYAESADAFNRHDFNAAFASCPGDVEWHPLAAIPGAHPLHGREAVVSWFRQVLSDFPDFRNANWDIREAGPGMFIVRFENRATGRTSGLAVAQESCQVWEIAREPWRVREYGSLTEALEAMGWRQEDLPPSHVKPPVEGAPLLGLDQRLDSRQHLCGR